jgi:hypothetical protein
VGNVADGSFVLSGMTIMHNIMSHHQNIVFIIVTMDVYIVHLFNGPRFTTVAAIGGHIDVCNFLLCFFSITGIIVQDWQWHFMGIVFFIINLIVGCC